MTHETGGARQAALVLHALAPADRAWMLGALPASERDDLLPLLAELEELGIARDPALIAQATANASIESMEPVWTGVDGAAAGLAARTSVLPSDEAWLEGLARSQVDALVRCLRVEPAALVAECLALADWSWREDVLTALEPAQRRRTEALLASFGVSADTPAALRAELISTLVARVRQQTTVSTASARWGWHELKQSFRKVVASTGVRGSAAP